MSSVTAPSPNEPLTTTWTDKISTVVNDLNDTYSHFTGTSTSIANGSWTDVPLATLTEGTAFGLSTSDHTTWTLVTPGLWTVHFSAVVVGANAMIFGLFASTSHTGGTTYAEMNAPSGSNQAAGSLSIELATTGSTTVVAAIFGVGGTGTLSTTTGMPRITFSCKAS